MYRMISSFRNLMIVLFLILFAFSDLSVNAQSKKAVYNSLFWEITGNGLKKPSYLFGTMHLSNKMVFRLSDSFFTAIKNSDVVALELNPEDWQNEMQRLEEESKKYNTFYSNYYTDYLRENTFTDNRFFENLTAGLRYEPEVNNQLLYRTDKRSEDFQEDTYLDLYIYQTGKKLGKQTAGVETFMSSQQMALEAMVDAASDKEKKQRPYNESSFDLIQVMQDAYRKGDLNTLDSVMKITEYSEKYTEKFLYKRNETQAHSMDSIMKQHSLFVGVGAAHLAGDRGVINLLRKKGYKLRPIFMQDRDAVQRQFLDTLNAPVQFQKHTEQDGTFSVSVPGKMNETSGNNVLSHYYGDMSNGAFYLITRLRTNPVFQGYGSRQLLKMVDSMLYENIPGTILSRKEITKDGYAGIDIINKIKKSDVQHYQLFITPTELLLFKMSGKGNYVYGKEADSFFSSIKIQPQQKESGWMVYTPPSGGFKVNMPAKTQTYYTASANDNLPEWRYESSDPVSGDKYIVYRKSIYSFDFIESDTFDLMLMQESLGSNKGWTIDKQAQNIAVNGRAVRDISYKTNNGQFIQSRAVLFGPQYYLLVHSSKDKKSDGVPFFKSFEYSPFVYTDEGTFKDTMLHFEVKTHVNLNIDGDVSNMLTYVRRNELLLKKDEEYSNTVDKKTVNFISEKTGEVIVVNTYRAPKYFYAKDSLSFLNAYTFVDSSLVLQSKNYNKRNDGTNVWQMVWADTGSTRLIKQIVLQKGMYLYEVNTMIDKELPESNFIRDFYSSFNILNVSSKPSLFEPKDETFFKDYYSKDSTVSNQAKKILSAVYFGKNGYPELVKALKKLDTKEEDYFSLKTALIDELGFIQDSSVTDNIIQDLKQIYLDAGDTSSFQNSVLRALARLKTPEATTIFKQLILQDPPVFENNYDYFSLFYAYRDSLRLSASLYPELLQLTSIEDYKEPVRELLVGLIDSNYLKPEAYESYFSSIFFDAKVAFKKMKSATENPRTVGNDNANLSSLYREYMNTYGDKNMSQAMEAMPVSSAMNNNSISFYNYLRLLIPYYDKNIGVKTYFDNVLRLNATKPKMDAALMLLKNKLPVSDSIWNAIAEDKEWRYPLLLSLKKMNRLDLMPVKYKTSEAIAKQGFYNNYSDADSIVELHKKAINFEGKPATVYFYKYKLKEAGDWKLFISGVNQEKGKMAELNRSLFKMTSEKIETSIAAQALADLENKSFKKLLIGNSNSGNYFYKTNSNNYSLGND